MIGNKITRAEALNVAREIIENAEREREDGAMTKHCMYPDWRKGKPDKMGDFLVVRDGEGGRTWLLAYTDTCMGKIRYWYDNGDPRDGATETLIPDDEITHWAPLDFAMPDET